VNKIIRAAVIFQFLSFFTLPIAAQESPEMVKGTVDLVLRANVTVTHHPTSIETGYPSFDSLLTRFGVTSMTPAFDLPVKAEHLAVFYRLNMDKHWVVRFADSISLDATATAFALDGLVESAEPISYGVATLLPIDAGFHRQWYHNQPNGVDINSPQGWDYDTSAAGVLVAVLDQGIDSLHRELKRNLWINAAETLATQRDPVYHQFIPDGNDDDSNGVADDFYGWDFSGAGDADPKPDYYDNPPCTQTDLNKMNHGTRVAGVLMAQNSLWLTDGNDMVGVMWYGSVLNVKVTNPGGVTNPDKYAAAIQYAAQTGAKVISMSFAFPYPGSNLGTAVQYADQLGSVQVAGVPNPGQDGEYPWKYPQVIGVYRIDANGQNEPHPIYRLDTTCVVAPGFNIYTTDALVPGRGWPDTLCEEFVGADYSYLTGTSLATPIVAGVAAMMIAHRKQLFGSLGEITPALAREIVWWTTDDYGPPGFDSLYGRGKVNLQKAMLVVGHGDVNNDHSIDINDPVYLINYIFNGGPPPQPQVMVGDSNCDGEIDISDVVYLLNYVFEVGAPPPICFQGP
jgi:subtilisin family serine protease